jgi:hypothetical protein
VWCRSSRLVSFGPMFGRVICLFVVVASFGPLRVVGPSAKGVAEEGAEERESARTGGRREQKNIHIPCTGLEPVSPT